MKYSPEFTFTDGIYKSYEEFKRNRPSIQQTVKTDQNGEVQFLVGREFKTEKVVYLDSSGNYQKLSNKEVWGYCSNGVVHIEMHNSFHRIFTIGAIILFVAERQAGAYTTDPHPPGVYAIMNTPELKQYLLDFSSGNLYPYTLSSFIQLLERDKELYKEFMSLKNDKERKKQMFIYLRKFNEKNPIYFKVN